MEHPSIDELVADRAALNNFIYTPIDEALIELERRWNDPSINDIPRVPDILQNGFTAVIFRQLVTSNYEIRRFISLVEVLTLKPIFWEYYSDKFTSNNEWKHSLGRLFFYKGQGKQGGAKIDSLNIIDFNTYNGKKISEVKTLWGQSLIDFHHTLFKERFGKTDAEFYDASSWFSENGKNAASYYEVFLSLFIKNGILFENFMLDEKEGDFTRDVFLPAFLRVYELTGKKPLIVSLEPTDIEGDRFWICHPDEDRPYIEEQFGAGYLT